MCALGLYSFQRASELNRLTWDDIDDTHTDPKQWRIAVYRQKTEDRDWLPLCQELRDELARWRLAYGTSVGETPRGHWYVVPAFKPGNWMQDENRRLAGQLLSAADLWIFVTTANRYADAVPWELLLDAAARDITVAVVLDRVPAGVEDEVAGDLSALLGRRGLGGSHRGYLDGFDQVRLLDACRLVRRRVASALAPALRGVENAFAPWSKLAP